MGLIASLPEIDKLMHSVYVMHERSEKYIPLHRHEKGQLSYVEGGLAYLQVKDKYYVIPARHYFWIPQGLSHVLKIGHSGTILRSVFFYTQDDGKDPFYSQVGIYPINDLLMQMIKYSESWDGHILPDDKRYSFLKVIKDILPDISSRKVPIALPYTENKRMQPILTFIDDNISEELTLELISNKFGLSERTLSRLFQATLKMSFLQYLKLLRIVRAIELILKTDYSISEIAYTVGYQSISSFSSAFYKLTNYRPTDFKKSL
ncbi:MAG TPA: AraC family transcriptional regulator [Cytophagaceae bacterium]